PPPRPRPRPAPWRLPPGRGPAQGPGHPAGRPAPRTARPAHASGWRHPPRPRGPAAAGPARRRPAPPAAPAGRRCGPASLRPVAGQSAGPARPRLPPALARRNRTRRTGSRPNPTAGPRARPGDAKGGNSLPPPCRPPGWRSPGWRWRWPWPAGRTGCGSWPSPVEDILDPHPEGAGDAEGQLQRRRVTPGFQRDDRLPGHAAGIGQRLLGHLPALEAQAPDLVADRRRSRRHRRSRRRSTARAGAPTASGPGPCPSLPAEPKTVRLSIPVLQPEVLAREVTYALRNVSRTLLSPAAMSTGPYIRL